MLEGELQSAAQALSLAQLAASKDAESMRARLQLDQPCPVCGAIDHPYATHSPAADAMLKGLQDHVKDKQKALRDLQDRIVLAAANKANAEKANDQIARELAQLEIVRVKQLADWSTLVLRLEIDAVPEPERTHRLLGRQEGVKRELVGLNQQEALYRDNLKLKNAAQTGVNTAARTVDQAKETLSGLATSGITTGQAIEPNFLS